MNHEFFMTTMLTELDLFFNECYTDLESKKHLLTSTEYRWAITTIRAIEILQSEKGFFSSIPDETERNKEINLRTKLAVHPGLILGTTPQEIELSIEKKIKKLQSTYLFDKMHGDTYTFFRDAFLGPSSFNEKMNSLRNYQLRMHHSRTEQMNENLFHTDPAALRLEEFMHLANEILKLSDKTPPSLETLLSFIQNHKDLAKQYGIENTLNILTVYKRACKVFLN